MVNGAVWSTFYYYRQREADLSWVEVTSEQTETKTCQAALLSLLSSSALTESVARLSGTGGLFILFIKRKISNLCPISFSWSIIIYSTVLFIFYFGKQIFLEDHHPPLPSKI